jgi:4-hydroxy-tetrahydrodipicolinate reductase
VVQWATGNVGSRALRRVIEHPELSLVGVFVHSANKGGRDAGELCGMAPVDIKATNRIEDIIALRPDCVLYMPRQTSYDEVCRLLESGVNIVTTRGDFHHPASMDPDLRRRVEEACQCGASSIHSTGSSPGFVTEALPIVLTSIQRNLNRLSINEFADVSSRDSPAMIFEIMGFGQKPGGSNQARHDYLAYSFGPSLRLVADALSLPLDGIKASGGEGVARHDTPIAAGVVPAGTVAAQRTTVSGMRSGKALITFTATWYVSSHVVTDSGEPWDFRPSGWHVFVDGDCPLDVSIGFPVAPEDYADMTPGLTAHRPVNTIPYICAAPPGIRTTVDLPQIVARLV